MYIPDQCITSTGTIANVIIMLRVSKAYRSHTRVAVAFLIFTRYQCPNVTSSSSFSGISYLLFVSRFSPSVGSCHPPGIAPLLPTSIFGRSSPRASFCSLFFLLTLPTTRFSPFSISPNRPLQLLQTLNEHQEHVHLPLSSSLLHTIHGTGQNLLFENSIFWCI